MGIYYANVNIPFKFDIRSRRLLRPLRGCHPNGMMPPMGATIIEKTKEEREHRKAIDLTRSSTPLANRLNESQREKILQYVVDEWNTHHRNLDTWRRKMKKWRRMSERDYADRVKTEDKDNPDKIADIFSIRNETLGMADGFVDFANAQAADDIFGTTPWLAARPEGKNDTDLAERVTKHSQWKINQSDLEDAIRDGINVACWGGTAFVKSRWVREVESFYKLGENVAYSKSTKQPILSQAGEFITDQQTLIDMRVDGTDVEWKQQETEETLTVYDNSRSSCIDFHDIAFNPKAQDLDLMFTPVFCRFRMGILDAIEYYEIADSFRPDLENAIVGSYEDARPEDGESATPIATDDPFAANQEISLVEGFVRMDPFGTGRPIRIHTVFSPTLNILFKIDYLANETPGGCLPVFPLRINKKPRRIFGVGYFEKYEEQNNAVDRQLNAAGYRDELAANVIIGFHRDALADENANSITIDAREPIELATEKTLSDAIEIATIPDRNQRSIELLNMHLQMGQMRSGITSAAQGELKGVPNASTATGVNQLMSRGAMLLKNPISRLISDIRKLVEFNVHLIYANQNRDETFTWGEGEDAELLQIVPGDVRGLRMNVSLTLVQAQNQEKLANAQAAIGIVAQYIQVPETDKPALRPLYVQAISSLGFRNAEDIIRQAVVDPIGILSIVPPEVAPIIEAALVSAGVMQLPVAGDESSAPVTAE